MAQPRRDRRCSRDSLKRPCPLGASRNSTSKPPRRGKAEDIVMTGGVVMSWHDLALYLITRYVGPVAAQAMARMLMLEWHGAGQASYIEGALSVPRRRNSCSSWVETVESSHPTYPAIRISPVMRLPSEVERR
jgi:hypothetical protein